jgi:tetratricopeptide (TPR) repeat protein
LPLDETLAEAHNSFAGVQELEWKWKPAEVEYKRSIELNPNYATAHHWYSIYVSNMGRPEEGPLEIKRALELGLLSTQIRKNVGDRYQDLRRFDDAIVRYRKIVEMDSNFALACRRIRDRLCHEGRV